MRRLRGSLREAVQECGLGALHVRALRLLVEKLETEAPEAEPTQAPEAQ